MNDMAADMLGALLRTTAAMSLAALAVAGLLRLARCRSAAVHRAAWLVVLVQGWLFWRMSLDVPWYDPPRRAAIAPWSESFVAAELLPAIVGDGRSLNAPIAPAASARRWGWREWLAAAWVCGMIVFVARWVASYARFVRGLPLGEPPDAADQEAWQRLLSERSVRRTIPLRVTRDHGPTLCLVPGGFRLVVPRTAWLKLLPEARIAVLRHELAHYLRGDVWKSLAARCLALPHWFNPCAWWAVRRFDEAAEWSCDEAAHIGDPELAPAYSRALLLLAAGRTNEGILRPAAQGRRLSLRIQRLLTPNAREDSAMKKTALISFALLLLVVAAVRVRLVTREAQAAEGGSGGAFGMAAAKAHLKEAQEMVATAKDTFEATDAAYHTGSEVFANLYVWSRRWMESERALADTQDEDLAALQGHWERMRRIYLRTHALYKAGAVGGESQKFWAAAYYLAEAELWLAAARDQ